MHNFETIRWSGIYFFPSMENDNDKRAMSLAFQFQLFSRHRFSSHFSTGKRSSFHSQLFGACIFVAIFRIFWFEAICSSFIVALCYPCPMYICIWTFFVSSDHPECFNALNTLTYNAQTLTHFPTTIFRKYVWLLVGFTTWNIRAFGKEQIVHPVHSNSVLLHPLIISSVTIKSESMGMFALKYRNSRKNSLNLYAMNSFSWISKSYFLHEIRVSQILCDVLKPIPHASHSHCYLILFRIAFFIRGFHRILCHSIYSCISFTHSLTSIFNFHFVSSAQNTKYMHVQTTMVNQRSTAYNIALADGGAVIALDLLQVSFVECFMQYFRALEMNLRMQLPLG